MTTTECEEKEGKYLRLSNLTSLALIPWANTPKYKKTIQT